MLATDENSSLNELLASAETDADFQAAESLIAEVERKTATVRPSRWIVDNLAEVARFFGTHPQTVRAWRLETIPMPGTQGRWDLEEIVRWRFEKLSNVGRPSYSANDPKKKLDLELSAVQLEQKRLDLSIQKGELLDRTDVELWASTALIEAREMVMSLPERLATSSPPEIRDYVREESDRHCRDVLTALRRRLEESAITQEEPE